MQTVLRSLESKLPYSIKLSIDVPRDLKILCHEQQLRLVLMHILRNAIDALESNKNEDPGYIDVSATRESLDRKPYTRISLCNSGPAIPDESIKHIFDPFFSSRDTGEGTGLGMSLGYMIIRQLGGKLEVKNEKGFVRFDILLPGWKRYLRGEGLPPDCSLNGFH